MTCNNANELIMKHMDGLLSKEESMELNQHLTVCDKCKQEFEVFNNLLQNFDYECEIVNNVDLGEDFNRSVMEEVFSIGYINKPTFLKKVLFNLSSILAFSIIGFCLVAFNNNESLQIFTFSNFMQHITLKVQSFTNSVYFDTIKDIFTNISITAAILGIFIYFKNFHKYYDLKHKYKQEN